MMGKALIHVLFMIVSDFVMPLLWGHSSYIIMLTIRYNVYVGDNGELSLGCTHMWQVTFHTWSIVAWLAWASDTTILDLYHQTVYVMLALNAQWWQCLILRSIYLILISILSTKRHKVQGWRPGPMQWHCQWDLLHHQHLSVYTVIKLLEDLTEDVTGQCFETFNLDSLKFGPLKFHNHRESVDNNHTDIAIDDRQLRQRLWIIHKVIIV